MDGFIRRRLLTGALAAVFFAAALALPVAQSRNPAKAEPAALAPQPARPDTADLDAVTRIKEEALQRSQVMDTLWYLTDVHGPRLTNSPAIRAAAAWAQGRLRDWAIPTVREETWGPFGRGWTNEKLTANVLAPQPFPLLAAPRAWTPGTDGAVTADAVVTAIRSDGDFATWTGKLAGKVVLNQPLADVRLLTIPMARRFTDQDLNDMQVQPVNPGRGRGGRGGRGGGAGNAAAFVERLNQFFAREGVVATLEPGSGRNDHGAILVHNAPASYRGATPPMMTPQLVVSSEQYNRIVRLVEGKIPVRLELNVQNRFVGDSLDTFNIVAELPGTDKAGEVVMLGAHFDSWHSGTGATDNAAGSAVMMEALRILKATGLRLRRTVRMVLWTGEEQGRLGSLAYVKEHFGDQATMVLKPEHARVSAYFNMDNGAGAIRGIYLEGNEAVRPVFTSWMEPFRTMGMTTMAIRGTGNTDHASIDAIGIPAFQFVQDPLEYGTDSHHSNNDVYDRVQAEDLMKNAAITASFVYHAAVRDELLPRKPLPRPRPQPTSTQ
jgi:carboxypeptidase Q